MRTFDLSPFHRTAVGFDQLFALLQHSAETNNSYPPHNIEAFADGRYRISMAVAGFSRGDIELVAERGTLTVSGQQPKEEGRKFLHRGIAMRDFRQRFELAEHVKIVSATLNDGLLHIDLVRELPETDRAKRIEIATGEASPQPRLETGA